MDQHDTTGFLLCMVSEERVRDVTQWLGSGSISELEGFLSTAGEHSQIVSHWVDLPQANNGPVMACLLEPVYHRVIGLPVISASCIRGSRCGLVAPLEILPAQHAALSKPVRITGVKNFSIRRDEHCKAKVFVDSSARVNAISTILDNKRNTTSAAVLSSQQDADSVQGWQSVHISTLPDTKSIAGYILNKINNTSDRTKFVDALGREGVDWSDHAKEMGSLSASSGIQPDATDSETEHEYEDWVILKSFAVSNPGSTMEALQRRFDTEPTDWKTFVCCMTGGQASLHISIAKDIRALVFLITLEGAQDRSECEFQLPSLHEAAMNDDSSLLEWLLQTSSAQVDKILQENDEEGFTVLQAACRVGSIDAVQLLTSGKLMESTVLTELVTETTSCGDTALHVSLKSDYPVILHELLKSADRKERSRLMSLKDHDGKTCEEVTRSDLVKYKLAAAVLKYHSWISSLMFEEFFTNYDYSLLGIDVSEKMLRSRQLRSQDHDMMQHSQQRLSEEGHLERGEIHFLNYDSMVFLKSYDLQKKIGNQAKCKEFLAKAVKYTNQVLTIDDRSIHALSNNALCLIRQDVHTDKRLETLAHRILEMQVMQGKHHYISVVDYAFAYAETLITDEARRRSSAILREALAEIQAMPDAKYLSAYCVYFHAKILIRRAQAQENRSRVQLQELVSDALECLITLAKQDIPEFNCDLWIWLAELQNVRVKQKVGPDFMAQCIAKYQREVGVDEDVNVDVAFCINQGEQVVGARGNEPRFIRRIGKLYLQLAYDTNNKEEKTRFYTKAAQVSDQLVINVPRPIFIAVTTTTKARIGIWAIRYSETHQQQIEEDSIDWYGRRKGMEEARLWSQAADKYFGPAEDIDGLLKATEQILHNLVFKHEGSDVCGERLARVKALLRAPKNEVESVFYFTLQRCDGRNKSSNYERFGRYYESVSDITNALQQYENSTAYYNENGGTSKPWLAKKRIRALTARQGSGRTNNWRSNRY